MEPHFHACPHPWPACITPHGWQGTYVFAERLGCNWLWLDTIPIFGKFGGATGNFNAHHVAYPASMWKFANKFINETLWSERCQTTTQIEHYDNMAAFFETWADQHHSDRSWPWYRPTISMDYSNKRWSDRNRLIHDCRTSSTIDFWKLRRQLGMANAIFEHMSAKLPVFAFPARPHRRNRNRNIEVPFAHSLIAYKSLLKGIGQTDLHESS